jgi:hypothetical protein
MGAGERFDQRQEVFDQLLAGGGLSSLRPRDEPAQPFAVLARPAVARGRPGLLRQLGRRDLLGPLACAAASGCSSFDFHAPSVLGSG